ncbi:PQQ-dependent sugar dehydrogenase [Silanimonas sp.]|jgi:glucose/arabinose dehydrogenase|uniref:PQQ-dependent sugar dehydrogenase n=1 Tax=Silanimonas sp. TaxID=1929290 RepID=UPI0022CB91DC|nr:PQQ-dependent sugar dehydrogenase [Silanimonas sp.]MCZ8113674.1 PQQ-dependent sugar dehydrogenase [Silanimonas sp.]
MSRRPLAALLALALALPAATTIAAASRDFPSESGTVRVTTVAEGLEHPWGLAFLPDGRMLVTERPGRLRIVNADGTLSRPIAGVPRVQARGQGGLLDVALHPQFAENGLVYLSFSEPGSGGAGTSVARGRLDGEALKDVQVIFRQSPKVDTGFHYGSRLVFDRSGQLWVSSGDRGMQDSAQDLTRGQGKLFKLNDDGTPATALPLAARAGTHPGVFSYGHRNIQGMALHPTTGLVWTHEHGPRGGDEINVPRAGRNYGWPVITYGINYNGTTIGDGLKEKDGMEQPLHQWTPSIGASGLAFYTADRFPAWKGNAFVGSLALTHLQRLVLDGERVADTEVLLDDWDERIRDVRQGPDGALYVLTDARNGQVAKVELLAR